MKRVFEGLTVVTVGVILLGNTTGVLPWTLWWTVLMLWPLLLVGAGIDILGRAVHSTALRVLASVLVLAGLIYGAAAGSGYAAQPPVFGPSGQSFSFSQPAAADGLTGDARIDAGLAKVTLRPGDALATASGVSPFGKPRFTTSTSGTNASVRISSSGGEGFAVPAGARSTLDVTLDRGMYWRALSLNGGVSDADLDLSDLPVGTFEANLGLSNVVVTFGTKRVSASAGGGTPPSIPPAGEPYVAKISGGLSTYRIRVPRDLGVELFAENGLGSVNVHGEGWQRTGGNGPFSGTWRTQGYDSAAAKLRLEINTGLSSIDVERF